MVCRERHVFDRFAVIFSVVIVRIYARLLTVGVVHKSSGPKTQLSCRSDRAGITGAAPCFICCSSRGLFLVSVISSIGTFIAVSRYASATPLPPSVLSRGIGWKVASMGLSIPQYFNKYTAVNGFGPIHTSHMGVNLELMFVCSSINMPFSSEAFVVGLLATFLDVTLHGKDNTTRNDRGMHWWDKFRSFKTDTRSEEFYSLPFNLNKVLPISVIFGHSFEVIPSILTIVLTLRKKKKNICLWTSLALNLSP
ncbi:hypothetical protein V6N13_149695 [Hibiscus sabdariffa]